jgi:hypothetical protein
MNLILLMMLCIVVQGMISIPAFIIVLVNQCHQQNFALPPSGPKQAPGPKRMSPDDAPTSFAGGLHHSPFILAG